MAVSQVSVSDATDADEKSLPPAGNGWTISFQNGSFGAEAYAAGTVRRSTFVRPVPMSLCNFSF